MAPLSGRPCPPVGQILAPSLVKYELDCEHSFHDVCLAAWLAKDNDNCPRCREVITSVTLTNIQRTVHYQRFLDFTKDPGYRLLDSGFRERVEEAMDFLYEECLGRTPYPLREKYPFDVNMLAMEVEQCLKTDDDKAMLLDFVRSAHVCRRKCRRENCYIRFLATY